MEKLTKELSELIKDIKLFPSSVLDIKAGVEEKDIKHFENILKLILPQDFRLFYSHINGFSLMGETIYAIGFNEKKSERVGLLDIYHREHFEVINPMPEYFLPFSPNGRGDHYCLDLRTRTKQGLCPVIFWQWDYSYFNPTDIETTHENFHEWLKDLLYDLKQEKTTLYEN